MRLLLAVCLVLAGSTARADDCERVTVWRDGSPIETVCRAVALNRGLTVFDLGDDWAPPILDGVGADTVPYRSTYLALAQERFADAGLDGVLAKRDRYLELFGIAPSPSVVQSRLADDKRHGCHDEVGDGALSQVSDRITLESAGAGQARVTTARALRERLERVRAREKLADLDALAEATPYYRRSLDRLTALETRIAAVRVVQGHLVCDGLLAADAIDGTYSWATKTAVKTFQRGAMILPSGALDAPTRDAFLAGSRVRDMDTALRVLQERVIAATGLVEDGTAGSGAGRVLGRMLVPDATWRVPGYDPLPDAAEDLISPTTEAAAIALGWRDVDSIRAFLDNLAAGETITHLVAVALPAPPAYHTSAMDLSVEIDRGDTRRASARRPVLVLYATVDDALVPLARWPTTIGGWQNEKVDDHIAQRWKDSPVGPRIWRDLYAGPRWQPPPTTPDRELVRGRALAREQFGPSYRAAFGMVAFIHLKQQTTRDSVQTWDEGIRTHGTGNLPSLANGVSHGCHRLLGFDVVRLSTFVLAHRQYVRRGDTPTHYRRVVHAGDRRLPIVINSLGYRIELVPPIPVEVLPGVIAHRHTHRRSAAR